MKIPFRSFGANIPSHYTRNCCIDVYQPSNVFKSTTNFTITNQFQFKHKFSSSLFNQSQRHKQQLLTFRQFTSQINIENDQHNNIHVKQEQIENQTSTAENQTNNTKRRDRHKQSVLHKAELGQSLLTGDDITAFVTRPKPIFKYSMPGDIVDNTVHPPQLISRQCRRCNKTNMAENLQMRPNGFRERICIPCVTITNRPSLEQSRRYEFIRKSKVWLREGTEQLQAQFTELQFQQERKCCECEEWKPDCQPIFKTPNDGRRHFKLRCLTCRKLSREKSLSKQRDYFTTRNQKKKQQQQQQSSVLSDSTSSPSITSLSESTVPAVRPVLYVKGDIFNSFDSSSAPRLIARQCKVCNQQLPLTKLRSAKRNGKKVYETICKICDNIKQRQRKKSRTIREAQTDPPHEMFDTSQPISSESSLPSVSSSNLLIPSLLSSLSSSGLSISSFPTLANWFPHDEWNLSITPIQLVKRQCLKCDEIFDVSELVSQSNPDGTSKFLRECKTCYTQQLKPFVKKRYVKQVKEKREEWTRQPQQETEQYFPTDKPYTEERKCKSCLSWLPYNTTYFRPPSHVLDKVREKCLICGLKQFYQSEKGRRSMQQQKRMAKEYQQETNGEI